MAKYSFEFKLQIVQDYLQGKGGFEFLAKKHNVPDHKIIHRWVKAYEAFGEEALVRCRQNNKYSFEYKLHVVELYLTSELSYQELALKVGMTDPATITRWVMEYRAAGPDALRPKKSGRKRKMDNKKIIREIEDSDSDEQKELLKQLQEENLKLRIENAFLKESRRLRLEEEARLNELRELSTVSEENSN